MNAKTHCLTSSGGKTNDRVSLNQKIILELFTGRGPIARDDSRHITND